MKNIIDFCITYNSLSEDAQNKVCELLKEKLTSEEILNIRLCAAGYQMMNDPGKYQQIKNAVAELFLDSIK